jgi:hypothetical protein
LTTASPINNLALVGVTSVLASSALPVTIDPSVAVVREEILSFIFDFDT